MPCAHLCAHFTKRSPPSASTIARTNAVDKGNGDFTFDFRSFESGGGEGGTGDADGDGTPDDPFANPDGGPLSRIEAKLDNMVAEKAAETDANAVKKFDEPASPDGSWKEAKPSQVNGGDSEVSDVVTSF